VKNAISFDVFFTRFHIQDDKLQHSSFLELHTYLSWTIKHQSGSWIVPTMSKKPIDGRHSATPWIDIQYAKGILEQLFSVDTHDSIKKK
jgi:hypothetical protein